MFPVFFVGGSLPLSRYGDVCQERAMKKATKRPHTRLPPRSPLFFTIIPFVIISGFYFIHIMITG